MSAVRPPAVATWLLRVLARRKGLDSLAGDLWEEYTAGRSGLWYWYQVMTAIAVGAARDVRDCTCLAARAKRKRIKRATEVRLMEFTRRQRLIIVVPILAVLVVGLAYLRQAAWVGSPPEPGDVIMLHNPRDPDRSVVKRVIATAGDTVRIEDGRVYVNDVLVPEEYVPPDLRRRNENRGPQIVEDAYYFVMDGNETDGAASRSWGHVPATWVLGRVD